MLKSRQALNNGSLKTLSIAQFKKVALDDMDFTGLVPKIGQQKSEFATQRNFANLNTATTHTVTIIRLNNVLAQRKILDRLEKMQQQRFPAPAMATVGGFQTYKMFNALFSGLEFMGFFLGFAFLAMLASCLMFKILSGANKDVVRYNMLNRIGTRRALMKQAVRGEILTLFALPGVLGIVDVLFGLQMFKPLMYHPYAMTG